MTLTNEGQIEEALQLSASGKENLIGSFSATLFSDQRATGSGTLTATGLPTMATGHSLGGHLAPTSLPIHHHRLAA